MTRRTATTDPAKALAQEIRISLPRTQNEGWGFYGTMGQQEPQPDQQEAWETAMLSIRDATGCENEDARAFLDSRHGRHYADDVASALFHGNSLAAAIQHATNRWMAWKISRTTERETGIPAGIPYLLGYVQHEAITAETD